MIFILCDQLNIPLEHPTKRRHALPTPLQVMTAPRFYASGSIQAIVTGENFNSESALKIELI